MHVCVCIILTDKEQSLSMLGHQLSKTVQREGEQPIYENLHI